MCRGGRGRSEEEICGRNSVYLGDYIKSASHKEKLLLCSHFEVLNFDNSLITAV